MKRRPFRVRNLLLGWTAYWLALIVVVLYAPIAAIWRMSQVPHGKGAVNVSDTNGVLSASVLQNGATTWAGSISVLSLALLITLPPLIMWAILLMTTSRTINAGNGELNYGGDAAELNAGEAEAFRNPSLTSKRRSREES